MIQLPEECEYHHVMTYIKVRQKVILTSNKSDINYDKELIRRLFYRPLEKRLLSSYVLQEIKSLKRNNASDEDLTVALTKASATEKERNLVQGKHHKKDLRVYEVSSTCHISSQAEMGCRDCFNNNKNYCKHCYKCGSLSHMARGCNKPPSGN